MKKLIILFSFINIFIGFSFCMEEREKPRSKEEQYELDKQLFNTLDDDEIEKLLKAGANPNATNKTGETALMSILKARVRAEEFEKRNSIIALLIEYGADLNSQDDILRTALTWAVMRNNFFAAELLLNRHANPNIKSSGGNTPLIAAITMVNIDNIKFIELLLNHGANPNVQNNAGKTPLQFAVSQNDPQAVQLLLARGANPFIRDRFGNSAWSIASDEMKALIKKFIKGPMKKFA